MLNLERSIEVPSDVLVRVIDGEAVLLNLVDEYYYGLDNVSTEFWNAITEKETLAEALASLGGVFEIDSDRLHADFEAFVGELIESGLLGWSDETASA